MDRKASIILMAVKYGGYLIAFSVTAGYSEEGRTVLLIFWAIIFLLDNLRFFFLESRAKVLLLPSLYFQLILISIFTILDQSAIAVVLYTILITEAFISYNRSTGNRFFFLAVTFYLISSIVSQLLQEKTVWDSVFLSLINSMVLIFAYSISYLAKRQAEERDRAEKALQDLEHSRYELEQAYARLLDSSKEKERIAVIEERGRMAREIHDTLAHTLTTVVVGLEAAKKLFTKDSDRALEELEKSQKQARAGLNDIRRSVQALRPQALEEQGFVGALKGLGRYFLEEGVGVVVKMKDNIQIPKQFEVPLFRVAQESITNSIRHGKATVIEVMLEQSEDFFYLMVTDNGQGCPNLTEGNGLRGMRERLEALGGKLETGNNHPRGFFVRAMIGGIDAHGKNKNTDC